MCLVSFGVIDEIYEYLFWFQGQAVINPTAHRLTFMAVEKMELYKFLLSILASSSEHYDVAFKIGLLSLELPRAPASIKPLEVG